jgi:NAD(P)-dependent dehydrogenase (short-subunit alcohol dehydrogenase family)
MKCYQLLDFRTMHRLRIRCIVSAALRLALQAATNASYPMGRIATAQEVAEAAVWVATRAKFMTGQTLVLDGGSMCS